MIQVIHRERYIDMIPLFRQDIIYLIHALPGFPELHRPVNGYTLSKRRVQGVEHPDLPVRIILQQFICRNNNIIAASAERTGESDVKNVLSFFQDLLKPLPDHRRIVCLGLRQFPVPHGLIKLVWRHIQFIPVYGIAE